jgi:hypothetical protein
MYVYIYVYVYIRSYFGSSPYTAGPARSLTIATMSGLTMYIAFSKADMDRVQDAGSIDNAAFNGWIPLKETPGIAVQAAMGSKIGAAAMAKGQTEWFVLEVTLHANEVAARFTDKSLSHRERELGAFYYKRPLRMIPDSCNWCWIQSNCTRCHTSSGLAPAIAVSNFCTKCWHQVGSTQ